ncbi:sulfotransferase [Myxococcota bacterium]|nr:sulfotransferase [Myxococcota bacterium]
MEDRLLFLISAPRSGSTLLARMLGTHSDIHAPAEPHLITPLAHLGYYEQVDTAPYDPIISRAAIHELVDQLPGGEADYLSALRAYSDDLYRRILDSTGRRVLLDKTPAYALVLDFLAKLYPNARYVVLTRNPLALWSSAVQSFYDGDHEAAHRHNPLLERYVPAIARFVRQAPVPMHALHYEALVQEPAAELRRICDFAGLSFEPEMVDYGQHSEARGSAARGLGDPVTVAKESRPTTDSLERWLQDMAGDPSKVEQAQRILDGLEDEDLAVWGWERPQLEAQLATVPETGARRRGRGLSRHTLERRVLVTLRRNIQNRPSLGRMVRRLKLLCDVLLR